MTDLVKFFDDLFDPDFLLPTGRKPYFGIADILRDGNLNWVCGKFPPTDIYIDNNTKQIIFSFALAGYKPEDVDVKFDGNYLVLNAKKRQETQTERMASRVYHGISSQRINERYYVPADKYQHDKVEASMKDGMLKVIIPPKEEAKKTESKINIKVE